MTSHHYLTAARCSLVVAVALTAGIACAHQPLLVYGPGGPAPAMKEAAAAFEHANGIKVTVTAGPTPSWIDHAKQDADIIYSGSETMMTDFTLAMGGKIQEASITPLYMRPLAILVRPGNPKHLRGVADLMQPGVRLLVVNGAGQNGVWEDMAGRKGSMESVRKVRANIASYAPNSASARDTWTSRTDIDAWLIWNIWQVSNPRLADVVPIEPDYAIYRDTGVALTEHGAANPQAKQFIAFLQSTQGSAIFAKWGWQK